VAPSIWEVTDAPHSTSPPVSLLPDPLSSWSPRRAAAVDLRGARVSAAAPCSELPAVAAAEPDRDPHPLPGLRAPGPGAGRAAADLAAPSGELPARRAPRDARRDIGAKPTRMRS